MKTAICIIILVLAMREIYMMFRHMRLEQYVRMGINFTAFVLIMNLAKICGNLLTTAGL